MSDPGCQTCGGTGVVSASDDMGGGDVTNSVCPDCHKPDPVAALAAMPCEGDGKCALQQVNYNFENCWPCRARWYPHLGGTLQRSVSEVARLRAENAKLREAAEAVVNATYKQIEEACSRLGAALTEEGEK